jgi:hypothetical protein
MLAALAGILQGLATWSDIANYWTVANQRRSFADRRNAVGLVHDSTPQTTVSEPRPQSALHRSYVRHRLWSSLVIVGLAAAGAVWFCHLAITAVRWVRACGGSSGRRMPFLTLSRKPD